MKYLLFIIVLLTFSNLQSQEKICEIGIGSSSLNGFSLLYRTGKQNNAWRFSLMYTRGYHSDYNAPMDSIANSKSSGTYGLSIKREHFIAFSNNLNFRIGGGLFGNYHNWKRDQIQNLNYEYLQNSQNQSLRIGLSGLFGIDYQVAKKIKFGLEFGPTISYEKYDQQFEYTRDDHIVRQDETSRESLLFTLDNRLFFTLFYAL
jgi:hypothetical protein